MGLENFIPEVWSARLLQNLHKALVYGQTGVINRDYEGEIKGAGDTVRINMVGPVTIGTYVKNSNMAAPQALTDAQLALLVSQAKYFNFGIDDVDKAQQKPQVMDEAMREAAYGLADVADQFIASLHTDVATANLVGTDASAIVPNLTAGTTVYDYLVDLGVKLDEANVPSAGRWAIVPPWIYGMLLKDDRFVGKSTPSADATLRNGVVGEAAGFTISKSNNVPNTAGAKYKILAGHPLAWSYAEQVNQVEGYRPEARFADAVKGLHLYGAKVVRPNALALLTASKT